MKPLVVLGDALLDADVEGRADRLCPEAPVPVVDVERRWHRPGGAGLAALLAARTTPDVTLVTALGEDPGGETLAQLLGHEVRLVRLPLRGKTIRKTRIRAGGQSVVRVDEGDGVAAADPLDPEVVDHLRSAGAILVADYGRGVAAHPRIRELLTELAARTPIVWDPHPRGPAPVPGVRLVTPNSGEAKGFAPGHAEPETLATLLREAWQADAVAVTTGSAGARIATDDGVTTIEVPAALRSRGQDTCGAGDRFAAAAATSLLAGQSPVEAARTAVESAARFVRAGGASALSAPQPDPVAPTRLGGADEVIARVRASGGRLVATGGCFDLLHPGHLALLRQARELGDALVVCLNSDDSVRRLKGPTRPILSERDRARLLTELSCVDAVVVFGEDSPTRLLDRLRPDVWVKGGDYAGAELPESEVVRRHGGEIVLVPTVAGYSTTKLVAAAG